MPAVRTWLGWWAVLTALYVVLVDTRRLQELVAAAVVGALGATAALLVQHEMPLGPRPPLRVVLRELRTVLEWPRDLALLGRALARRPHGRTVEVPFDGDATEGAVAAAGRSLAPNRIVVDVDRDRGVLTYHELVERNP